MQRRQRLYWTVNSLPEVRGLSPRLRRSLLRSARRGGQAQLVLGALLCTALIGPLCVGIFLVPWATKKWPIGLSVATGGVALVLLAAVIYQALLSGLRRALRQVVERLAPQGRLLACLECGYNLQGSRSEKCPECGAPVVVAPPGET